MRSISTTIFLIFLSTGLLFGQANNTLISTPAEGSPGAISLEVPVGTPLPVVLDADVRIQKTGQVIHGKIAEPVYAFDKLVVPAGSEVTGSVIRIASVSKVKRTRAAMD